MAFVIQRHSLEDVHGVMNQAAQAKADFAATMQEREFAFKQQSQMMGIQAQQEMQEQNFMNKLEIAAVGQHMNKEAAMMKHQLDLQKIAIMDQNDFDRMMMQQSQIKDRIWENKVARAQEMQGRMDALDKAYNGGKGGEISKETYTNAMISLISGYRVPKKDFMEQLLGEVQQDPVAQFAEGMDGSQVEQLFAADQARGGTATSSLEELAGQNAYNNVETGKLWWKKNEAVANIPVMKANLTLALQSNKMDNYAKQQLLAIIKNGSDMAVEAAYKKVFFGSQPTQSVGL